MRKALLLVRGCSLVSLGTTLLRPCRLHVFGSCLRSIPSTIDVRAAQVLREWVFEVGPSPNSHCYPILRLQLVAPPSSRPRGQPLTVVETVLQKHPPLGHSPAAYLCRRLLDVLVFRI